MFVASVCIKPYSFLINIYQYVYIGLSYGQRKCANDELLSYFQVGAPIFFSFFFSLTIKDKIKISLTIKMLHLGQGSFTRKVRTIFTLKIIVSIFVKLFLRSEDTKWHQFEFQFFFVCVLILMSYIDNSNKKMGSPSSFFRNLS